MKLNITNKLQVNQGSCRTDLYVYRHTKVVKELPVERTGELRRDRGL